MEGSLWNYGMVSETRPVFLTVSIRHLTLSDPKAGLETARGTKP
jgi:hypothetical protein